jgi:fructose 1,6-bisphosphatase
VPLLISYSISLIFVRKRNDPGLQNLRLHRITSAKFNEQTKEIEYEISKGTTVNAYDVKDSDLITPPINAEISHWEQKIDYDPILQRSKYEQHTKEILDGVATQVLPDAVARELKKDDYHPQERPAPYA